MVRRQGGGVTPEEDGYGGRVKPAVLDAAVWPVPGRSARRGRGLARRRSWVAWPCGLVPIAGRRGCVVAAAPRSVPVNGDLRGCDVVWVAVHDETAIY